MDAPKDEREILMVEYQMAQQSAEHHDGALWQITSITWAAMIVLFGFVLANASNPDAIFYILLASLIGFFMIIFLLTHVAVLNNVKNQKYARCKEIEKIYGMKQHSTLSYPRRISRLLFYYMMGVFLLTWLIVIGFSIFNLATTYLA